MASMESKAIKLFRDMKKVWITEKELAKKIGLKKSDKQDLRAIVDELVGVDKLIEKGGKYILAENLGLVGALIVKVNGTFGFAKPDEGDKDVFIPGRLLAGSMPGDRVLLKITRGTGELPEGEVFKVTAEADQKFSAVLEVAPDGSSAMVTPDRYVKFPLAVSPTKLMGAKSGDKVLCQITQRGKRHSEHRARILETFGSAHGAAACCQAILAANNIHEQFPDEVLEQAQAIAAGQGIHPKELATRLDLREELIFTIDSADSKDLDDAISLKRCEYGWELGVHIADVSYYVTHQSPLDKEAFARGTSVYYANAVIPMLPPELSNGICSLNPGEDRLAFSALMRLDDDGKLVSFRFAKSVILSRVKGVYSEINAILDGSADEAILSKYADLLSTIHEMHTLSILLTKARYARGGINLESTESKIVLDEAGRAVDVVPRSRGVSEEMIEEFMLTANEAAATLALEQHLPFVYRVHENPAPDRINALFDVLEQLGVKAKRPKTGVDAFTLSAILNQVRDTPIERVVNTMVLRSMAKAKYSEVGVGHFGLALKNYAHFTSPIRRYPDLTIHRILSGYVTGMKHENIDKRFGKFVVESANHSFEREVAAMTAERSCEDCYKAEYMRLHLGEELDGIITSVVPFGIYIQLPSTVEGLCHISNFPEGEWQADGNLAFVERRTGKKMRLGDPVRIQVAGADVSAGTVDFVLLLE